MLLNHPRVPTPPWTKAELRAVIKDLPKVTEGPHRLVEEFNIRTLIYQPGLQSLSVHVLVGEGQAQHWVKIISRV